MKTSSTRHLQIMLCNIFHFLVFRYVPIDQNFCNLRCGINLSKQAFNYQMPCHENRCLKNHISNEKCSFAPLKYYSKYHNFLYIIRAKRMLTYLFPFSICFEFFFGKNSWKEFVFANLFYPFLKSSLKILLDMI